MPSFDTGAMDEALALMEEIGMDAWRVRRAYINGTATLAEYEAALDRAFGLEADRD